MQVKDILSLVFEGITAIAIIFTGRQIQINRKQLNLSVIAKCVKDFRELGHIDLITQDFETVRKYIEIVNEELFYMQRNYLPKDVSKEWVDGIIDFLPVINKKNDTILNTGNCIKLIEENIFELLASFPRIRHTFAISKKYNFSLIYTKENSDLIHRINERNRLVKEILKNLKGFKM